MKFVRIQCNGIMDEIEDTLNFRSIKKILENHCLRKGSGTIQHLYTWKHEKSKILCYGYFTGSAGSENKHDLPPLAEKNIISLDNYCQYP